MAAVVLRTARPTALQIDAQHHPPCRQAAQAQYGSNAGKGRTVIAANGTRQPMFAKQRFKTVPHSFHACICYRAQLQYVPAVLIAHGQGLAALALATVPPTLEIHCPDFVGRLGFAPTAQAPCLLPAPQPSMLHHPSSFQDPFEATLAWHLGMQSPIHMPQLFGTPGLVLLLQPHHLTDNPF